MEWIVILVLGVIVGLLASFITAEAGMPQPLTLILGVFGVFIGAFLSKVTGFNAIGPATIYIMGTVLAICLLAGGTLAYTLTK